MWKTALGMNMPLLACRHHDQVVETMGFRVVRHWLDGPNKGQSETFIGSLPGFPDGITRSANVYDNFSF